MDFGSSSGYVVMDSVKDYIKVKGDFITQSNAQYSGSINILSAGIMEIGGDFKQLLGNTYNFDCMN